MIDLNEMINLQQVGAQDIKNLSEAEQNILIQYCNGAGLSLLKGAQAAKLDIGTTVINIFRFGMALGLKLEIKNGEVVSR